MKNFLSKVKNKDLHDLIDSVPLGNSAEFTEVLKKFPNYDSSFLWLLCYAKEEQPNNRNYIEDSYAKYCKVLDRGFPQILASKGNFHSRMWELILCDVLSVSGKMQPKSAAGADFVLELPNGLVQVEAVAPNESGQENMRAIRPDYSTSNIFGFGGPIHDLERPVLLRVLQAFDDKKDGYNRSLPLILAINSYKAVGMISDDSYILRRILFGLGNLTLTKTSEGDYTKGFEQLPFYNKPGEPPFPIAYFRRHEYKHISGIIYTSQNPLGFIPGGFSWNNSGITFVPNPLANYPIQCEFPYFRKIMCSEGKYQEFEPSQKFESNVTVK